MTLMLVILMIPEWTSVQEKLTSELATQISNASPNTFIPCIVVMKEGYPYKETEIYTVKERIKIYREIAERSQKPLIEWLLGRTDAKIGQRFWVINGFYLEAKPEVIIQIAQRPDVSLISHDGEVRLIEHENQTVPSSRGIPWNITKVRADSCWSAGYTGQGVILGIIDSGADYTHPALAGKWTGYWYVASGLPQSPTPYDDNGHGTHCLGTILGGDGPGPFPEDVGIAFNARYVAAKGINSSGTGTYNGLLQCMQFIANLKESVDVKAVSNSWGSIYVNDTFFYPITRTYLSIGIVPVFANGNSGTSGSNIPGNYSTVIGVGATDSTDTIASFSSRGPAPNLPPWNDTSTWLRTDWNRIKPNITAPGVSVYSCIPGGGYTTKNGTSMATPHVTGTIGLLCQKNPTLSPRLIYSILIDHVDKPSRGEPYPNNTYGWGRLNAWKAVQKTPRINQPYLSVVNIVIADPPPGGNGNGLVEPGETAQLIAYIENVCEQPGVNTTGNLKTFDNFITINNPFHSFGTILPRQVVANPNNPFIFTAHNLTPHGHKANLGLIVNSDGPHDTLDFCDTFLFSLQIGTPPPPHAILEDDFEYGSGIDSFLYYWDTTGNWVRTSNQSFSPPYSAYSGVPYDSLLRTLTLKNSLDLTTFQEPELRFWHKYYFYPQNQVVDTVAVRVSTDGGSTWLSLWSYRWQNEPESIPWTEMRIPLTSYISNNLKIRFLSKIKIFGGSRQFHWWIDNFRITTPYDNEPPYFTNTTRWTDTSFTGPFPVHSTVTDVNGVDSVYLYYRINSGNWQRLVMSHQGNNIYQATIPSQVLNTRIDYYLWARDKWVYPNSGCDPVGAPNDGYYSFQIRPVGAVEQLPGDGLTFALSVSNPMRDDVRLKYATPISVRVTIIAYDITGRQVRKLLDQDVNPGQYELSWDNKDDTGRRVSAGVYFIRMVAHTFCKTEKIIRIR
ncbi:MAG: S8 family serine peptidase [candidate division WOR-3 bacterium]